MDLSRLISTFAFMKLFYILLLLSGQLYCQRLIQSPYIIKMESKPIIHLPIPLTTNSGILMLSKSNRFKLTIKASINPTKSILTNELDTEDDYLSMGNYDIRGKYYLTKKFRLFCRVVTTSGLITGINSNGYYTTIGMLYKF